MHSITYSRVLTRYVAEPLKVRALEEVIQRDAYRGERATANTSDMPLGGLARLKRDRDRLGVGGNLSDFEGEETEGGNDGQHPWLVDGGSGMERSHDRRELGGNGATLACFENPCDILYMGGGRLPLVGWVEMRGKRRMVRGTISLGCNGARHSDQEQTVLTIRRGMEFAMGLARSVATRGWAVYSTEGGWETTRGN